MPRIQPIAPEHADSATADALAGVRAKLGILPNLFTTFAQSPVALQAYLQFTQAVSRGRLDGRQRELIAVAVAQENSCAYCLSAHVALGRSAGLGDEAIQLAREGCAAGRLDNAIIEFALNVVGSRGGVSDDDLGRLRAAGADDGLVVEVVANVVLNIFTNYLNRVAGTEIDFPPVDLDSAA